MKAGSLYHMEPAPLGLSHIRNIARVNCLPGLEIKKAGMKKKTKQAHEHNKKNPQNNNNEKPQSTNQPKKPTKPKQKP